jgi:creatinine amidohydrolase
MAIDMKLRSRQFTDLTNYEIEKYLERNDIIVIPVGNCETHAGYPVDSEFVMVEGYARLIAEKTDGLFLPNVVYFNPGGTQIGRGTVHMSMSESLRYTKELAHSLLNQGFRRQIWIPSHVPTSDFLLAMVTEFFDETKVPVLFLDIHAYLSNLGVMPPMSFDPNQPKPKTASGKEVDPFGDVMLAGYKLAGRLQAVPAKGEVDFPPAEKDPGEIFPNWFPEYRLLSMCSRTMGAPAPFYYSKPDDHIGPPIAEFTREELEERAEAGEEYMRELLDKAQLDELMLSLRHLQDYMKEIALKHYDHLPKNRFSANPF